MKVYWWQGGVHVEPENGDERRTLSELVKALQTGLKIIDLGHAIPDGPVLDLDDKKPVVGV